MREKKRRTFAEILVSISLYSDEGGRLSTGLVVVDKTKMAARNGQQKPGGATMSNWTDDQSPQVLRKRFRRDNDLSSALFNTDRNGPNNEGKYVRMTGTKESLSEINPIILTRIITDLASGFSDCRRNRDGQITFMTKNASQARKIIGKRNLQISPSQTIEVEITMIESLNCSRGTIFGSDLIKIPIDEDENSLLPNLKEYGVTAIEKIKTRGRDGNLDFLGLHVLTFDTRNVPTEVMVGFLHFSVKEWVPSPMKCQFCLEFGHTKNRCSKNVKLCRKCNNPEHEDQCHEIKCHHCLPPSDKHESFSMMCPVMKKEKRICQEKVARGISFAQARKIVENDANIDFANALKKGMNDNREAIQNIDEEQRLAEAILEELQRKVEKLQLTQQMIMELKAKEADLTIQNLELAHGLELPEVEDEVEMESQSENDDEESDTSATTSINTSQKKTLKKKPTAMQKRMSSENKPVKLQKTHDLRMSNVPKMVTKEIYHKLNETAIAQYNKFANANPKVIPHYVKSSTGKITFCAPVFPSQ